MTSRSRITGNPASTSNMNLWRERTEYRYQYPGPSYEERIVGPDFDLRGISHPTPNAESMDDTVGEFSKYNTVVHIKDIPHNIVYPSGTIRLASPPIVTSWRTLERRLYGGGGLSSPKYHFTNYPKPSLPPILWNDLVHDVGEKLDGRMVTRNNIIVTVAESFKTLQMIKNPLKGLRSLFGASGKKTFLDISKAVANTRLEYQYGWKQLYRDVHALASVYDQVTNHMKYIRDNIGVSLPVSSSQEDEALPGTVYTWDSSEFRREFEFTKYKRTARFSCVHVIDDLALSHSRWQHTLDALGVDKLAGAVWDLIPYSFVFDWFFKLDRLVYQNLLRLNSHKMRRLGYSTKEEWHFRPKTRTRLLSPGAGTPTEYVYWAGEEELYRKVYTRTPGFPPDTSGTGVFGTLSIANLADGASLIAQRLG